MSSPVADVSATASETNEQQQQQVQVPDVPDEVPSGPVYYRHLDLAAALAPDRFLPLDKVGGLYVARLRAPLLVQTPPLTLASPLDDEDGSPLPHAHVSVPRAFQAFVQRAEELVLEACLANKASWFRRPLEDDSLRASFKTFYKPGGALKIKVPRDALVFDAAGQVLCREDVVPGTAVRCLLELSRVCFGRTEFGAMWSLAQAQTAPAPPPPPKCMIVQGADLEDEPCGAAAGPDGDSEVHEFL